MVRKVLGVIAGVVVAMLLVMIIEMVGHYVFPPPPFDYSDPEARRLAMANAPAGALLTVLAAYFIAVLAGGWTAGRIAGGLAWPARVVAGLILLAAVANLFMLPHPAWFAVLAVLLVVVAGWIAGQLASRGPLVPRRG